MLREDVYNTINQATLQYQPSGQEDLLALELDIEGLRNQYNSAIAERGIAAGKAAMNEAARIKETELTSLITANPQALPDALLAWEQWVNQNYAPAMNPAEEAAVRQAGTENLATAAIDFLIINRQYDEALSEMQKPAIASMLSDGRSRNLRLKIYAGQGEAEKIAAEAAAKLDTLRQFGINESDPNWSRIAVAATTGITLPAAKKTFGDEINEVNDALAQIGAPPLTAEQIREAADANVTNTGGSDIFGRSLEGRLLGELRDLGPAITAGFATPQEIDDFVFMAGALAGRIDRDGNKFQLPASIREGLHALGIDPTALTSDAGISQLQQARGQGAVGAPSTADGTPAPEAGTVQASPEVLAQIDQTSNEILSVGEAVPTTPDGTAEPSAMLREMERRSVNIFGMADLVRGIVPSVGRTVADLPVIGDILPAPQMNQAKQAVDLFINTSIVGLQRTDRFGSAEREDLIARLNRIGPAFLGNPNTFRDSMMALDDVLAVEEAFVQDTLSREGAVSGKQFNELKDRMNVIQQIRAIAGVPPLVTSTEEFDAAIRDRQLGPDDLVRLPDNRLVTVKKVRDAMSAQQEGGDNDG